MSNLLDFAVAEDCGTMVNPMLVEGQIRGGVVQGIGTALYEEIPYDEAGQPLAGTFADYLLPGAAELPAIKIGHLHTPATATEYGMKGMGEGGAVAPPAAIANAVRDALAAIGAEVNETPITPRRVLAAIAAARPAGHLRRQRRDPSVAQRSGCSLPGGWCPQRQFVIFRRLPQWVADRRRPEHLACHGSGYIGSS